VIVVDTGPLVAAANSNDQYHASCAQFLRSAWAQRIELLVPQTVVAEVCHLLSRDTHGVAAEARFLRLFSRRALTLVCLEPADTDRMAELVEEYADWPLGRTDASVVAIAERLKVQEIATVDDRHFRPIKPRHVQAFTLLPRPLTVS
jgi:predicted nucleic acid-binding protein